MKLRRSTSEPKVEKDRRNNEERVMDQKIISNTLHILVALEPTFWPTDADIRSFGI